MLFPPLQKVIIHFDSRKTQRFNCVTINHHFPSILCCAQASPLLLCMCPARAYVHICLSLPCFSPLSILFRWWLLSSKCFSVQQKPLVSRRLRLFGISSSQCFRTEQFRHTNTMNEKLMCVDIRRTTESETANRVPKSYSSALMVRGVENEEFVVCLVTHWTH